METLKKFKQFVDEINLENGRNYKLSVLEKYKDDEVIKKYLQYVFDPFNIFGIAEKKLNKSISRCEDGIASVFGILDYLLEHNTGRDYDVAMALTTRGLLDDNLKVLFDKIITKNLILGISAATINKVMPNTVVEFNVQLANKYFDMKPGFLAEKEFALTTKIDGMRCVMLKENGNVTFWSRQGQPIEGLVDLEEEAKKCFEDDIVLDGELIASVDNIEDTYKQTIRRARTKDVEKHNLKMMVFDCMFINDFKNQNCQETYLSRRNNLLCIFAQCNKQDYINKLGEGGELNKKTQVYKDSLLKMINQDYTYFELLPILYQGTDTNKIEEILKEQVANGEEGIMINVVDAPYEFKRTNNLLKVKLFNSCDLRIVGFEAGTNKLAGTLGALLLEYKDNIVKCGSGFTDEQRNEIWNNQEKYLNTIVEITYFEETENANGTKSLRFPVFKDFRTDKNEPNY